MMKCLVRTGVVVSTAISAVGGDETHAAFERLPVGPASAALGGVLAVSPESVFGNPAPRAASPSRHVAVWGSRPFGLPGLVEAQAEVGWRRGAVGLGLGFRRFGNGVYAEKEVRVASGWQASRTLAVGGAVRGLSVEGAGFAPRRAVALDAGLRFRPDANSEIGAGLEATLGDVPGDPEGRLRRSAIGVSRRFGGLTIRVEVQRREDRPLASVVGLEWTPPAPFVLRLGAREDPSSVTWGLAVRHAGIELAASTAYVALGRTLRVGIAISREPQR